MPRRFDATAYADQILRFDKNDDQRITADELPQRMRAIVEEGDRNNDDALDREEIVALARGSGD